MTEHPDALEASGTRLKVLECGVDSRCPVLLGSVPKTERFWDGFGRLSRLAQLTIGGSETQ